MGSIDAIRFRTLLEAERLRVAHAIESLHDVGPGGPEVDPSAIGLGAGSASATFDRELDEGLEGSAQHTLGEIERALTRIDDGTFGVCERCGKRIAEERLLVRPWATLCIDDQRAAGRG